MAVAPLRQAVAAALPDIGGLDLIHKIPGRDGEVPIDVLSNCGDEAVKISALGANDHVSKPFSMDELLARIRVATRRHPHPLGARLP